MNNRLTLAASLKKHTEENRDTQKQKEFKEIFGDTHLHGTFVSWYDLPATQ